MTTYLFLPDIEQWLRYLLVALVALVAYMLPAILYGSVLSKMRMDPGPAAGLLLFISGIASMPLVLALLATRVLKNGELVPWWAQGTSWVVAGACFALLGLVALVAVSSGSGNKS